MLICFDKGPVVLDAETETFSVVSGTAEKAQN